MSPDDRIFEEDEKRNKKIDVDSIVDPDIGMTEVRESYDYDGDPFAGKGW